MEFQNRPYVFARHKLSFVSVLLSPLALPESGLVSPNILPGYFSLSYFIFILSFFLSCGVSFHYPL